MTLMNLGDRTETFTLIPAGLLAGWVRIEPPTVTLFGGSHENIRVTVRPPQLASTPAGPAGLTVRVIPQDDPDEVVIAETTVVIGAFHDRRIHLLQPVVRSRRRATYEFLLENQGNSQASCRLHLIDTSQRLDGDFDPPAVGVEPGANSLVRLRMKAVRRQWRHGSRTLPFSIEADQQGFPTAVGNATFVQTPTIPERLGRRAAAAALIVAALAGAWFALVKPLTERTARDAVTNQTSVTVVDTTLPGQITPPVTDPDDTNDTTDTNDTIAPTTTPVALVADNGQPFNKLFGAPVAQNDSKADSYRVPEGQQLRITDLWYQNTNEDEGRLTFARNDEAIHVWNMRLAADGESVAFRSPIVFASGDVVNVTLTCDAPGDLTSGDCSTALYVSGTLVATP